MRQLVGASSRQPGGTPNVSEQPNDLTATHLDFRQQIAALFLRNEFSGKEIKNRCRLWRRQELCVYGGRFGVGQALLVDSQAIVVGIC